MSPQGFLSPRFIAVSPIAITNPAIANVLGEARFSSVTFRLFKLPKGSLETTAEDYGQFATCALCVFPNQLSAAGSAGARARAYR